MPLTTQRANEMTAAINTAFEDIGQSHGKERPAAPGTGMPKSKSNQEPTAWEYFVATHLARLAEARKRRAQAAAVKAGVLFDPEKEPRPIGTNALVYAGDVVEIAVAVATPGTRLDQEGLVKDLEKAGLALPRINKIINANTLENRAPHKFSSTLATV